MKTKVLSSRVRLVTYKYNERLPVNTSSDDLFRESNNEVTSHIVEKGIVSISLQKNKNTPAANVSIKFVGRPHHSIVAGTWIVLRHKEGKSWDGANSRDGMPIFIGQIRSVNVNTYTEGNANKPIMVQLNCIEWGYVLNIPVMYDIYNNLQILKQNSNLVNVAENIINEVKKYNTSRFTAVAKDSFNYWKYVAFILSYIGAVTNYDMDKITQNMNSKGYNTENINTLIKEGQNISTTMPIMPFDLMFDLGIEASGGGFYSIFELLLGVQTQKVELENNLFKNREQILNMLSPEGDRPLITNVGPELAQGGQAWQLMKGRLDEDVCNELFTSTFCYKNGDEYHAQPVVVARDKPIITRNMHDTLGFEYSWTIFDDIPRIIIDKENITEITINNTVDNTSNYILATFNSQLLKHDGNISKLVRAYSRYKNQGTMDRFGGKSFTYNTSYLPLKNTDTKSEFDLKWFEDLKKINALFRTSDYRLWHGSMTVIAPDYPINQGLNIQFKYNKLECVAQIDNYSINYGISGDGSRQLVYNVTFTNMFVLDRNGNCVFPEPNFHIEALTKQRTNDQIDGINSVDLNDSSFESWASYQDAIDKQYEDQEGNK